MRYSKAICEMLDKIAEKIKEDNKIIQLGNNNLEKYIAEYITGAIIQYAENEYLSINMTETQVIELYNHIESNNLLQDIIQFVYSSSDEQYPLFLEYEYAYNMLIDYAEFLDSVRGHCLNCGKDYFVNRKDIKKDELGNHTTCVYFGASFDVTI